MPTSTSTGTVISAGAVAWLLPADGSNEIGKYKLTKKACNHPCVVLQDLRKTTGLLQICVLTSCSQHALHTMSVEERKFHVPISPLPANSLANPSQVTLRARFPPLPLRKLSWINTKKSYYVPEHFLGVYERGYSYSRWMLTKESTEALQRAIGTEQAGFSEPSCTSMDRHAIVAMLSTAEPLVQYERVSNFAGRFHAADLLEEPIAHDHEVLRSSTQPESMTATVLEDDAIDSQGSTKSSCSCQLNVHRIPPCLTPLRSWCRYFDLQIGVGCAVGLVCLEELISSSLNGALTLTTK